MKQKEKKKNLNKMQVACVSYFSPLAQTCKGEVPNKRANLKLQGGE